MESLYHQTNNLIQQIQANFQYLQNNTGNIEETENDIQEKINIININCEKLYVYLYKVPIEHRQSTKMRFDQLKYDNRHLQAALENFKQKRLKREQLISEREQLLSKRFTQNSDLTTINIDYAIQHQNSLQNSNRGVDEMLSTGVNALESLRSQRITLKGARRRILSMANTLGLSNHTMRLIEKRVIEDKYIFLFGVVITIIVIVLVVIYLI